MPEETTPSTCSTCDGTGLSGADPCSVCIGIGALPLFGHNLLFKFLLSKLEVIIAEQASQREDLTAALTQIWNKVKDL